MLTAVDHVQLAAPPGREDLLRAFYADVLGMTEIPKPPALAARGGCWFRAGAVHLHLGIEDGFRPARKAHPGLRVTDIEAYAERLTAGGATVTWDDGLPGHRRFYSQDPVGNRLEFLEPMPQVAVCPGPITVTRRSDQEVRPGQEVSTVSGHQKAKAKKEQIKGKAKEIGGRVTHDLPAEAEGRLEQSKGDARQAKEKTKDIFKH